MRQLKIKKVLAWLVDFFVYFYGVMLFFTIFDTIVLKLSISIQIIFVIILFITMYLSYSKKDILFGGRSLGKRIFSSAIYNELGVAVDYDVKKKRGTIEMFTFPLDFWFLLFLGRQIADYVCKTDVMDYKEDKELVRQ